MPAPTVSVMMCTYNRRDLLRVAIRSVLEQTFTDFELIIVRDGGDDVSDVVGSFDDERIVYFSRDDNRGKGASLNQGLSCARGKYLAYLDDDDKWYPQHLERLAAALRDNPDCGAAYSNLLKVHYRPTEFGRRQVLAKALDVRRDFDRFFLFYFSHVLHVSLMHERALLDRTGPYSESLAGLIDWDMVRRLAFFTEFIRVREVTGEYYAAVENSDRISVKVRTDAEEYLKNVLAIRSTRPKKPWAKVADLAVVVMADRWDDDLRQLLCNIRLWTFYPYEVTVLLPPGELERVPEFESLPLRRLASDPGRSRLDNLGYAACVLDADLVATVPPGTNVGEMWVEFAVHHLISAGDRRFAVALEGGEAERPLVLRRELIMDCLGSDAATLEDALAAEGVSVEPVDTENGPFVFDTMFTTAKDLEARGRFAEAADLYEKMIRRKENVLWMHERLAGVLYRLERDDAAADECRIVNEACPNVESLRLEASIEKRRGDARKSLQLLESAYELLRN